MNTLAQEALAYLDHQAAALRQQGLTEVDKRHLTGAAARAIVDVARDTPRSCIAMCSHGRSGIQRWALGSIADAVISHGAVPVLVIRAT
jgi:nucleotide-binding universal stress UspA family protein